MRRKKFLNYVILSGLLFISINTFAQPKDKYQFKTLTEAQQYCPSPNAVTFTPGLPASWPFQDFAYKEGTFLGEKNGKTFTNTYSCLIKTFRHGCPLIMAPLRSNASKQIDGLQFFKILGSYGHIFKKQITCFYNYPSKKINGEPIYGVVILTSQK